MNWILLLGAQEEKFIRLAQLLGPEYDYHWCSEAFRIHKTISQLKEIRTRPGAVVCCLDIPVDCDPAEKLSVISRVQGIYPSIKIFVWTEHELDWWVERSLAHGAEKYFVAGKQDNELARAVKKLFNEINPSSL